MKDEYELARKREKGVGGNKPFSWSLNFIKCVFLFERMSQRVFSFKLDRLRRLGKMAWMIEALFISSCDYIKVVMETERIASRVTWGLDEQKPYNWGEK